METKLVVTHRDEMATIGVTKTDCDPIFYKLRGPLVAVLHAVPGLIAQAEAKWQTAPKNPAAVLPKPPPAPSNASQRAAAPVTSATRPASAPRPQQAMPGV